MKFTGLRTITLRRISDDVPIAEVWIDETAEINIASEAVYMEEALDGADTFDAAQKTAIRAVNLYAGRIRNKFMSEGLGIELVYMRKDMEAHAYDAAGRPTLVDGSTYPFIWEEAQAMGLTPSEVCDRILARTVALSDIGSRMEGARMAALVPVESATTMEELATAKLAALRSLQVFAQ